MNVEEWQANNSRYLSAALEWLRLRLMQLAPIEPHADRLPVPAVKPSLVNRVLGRPASLQRLALPQPLVIDPDQITRAADDLRALEAADPPPGLIMLRRQLGLSQFESDVLLLCAALELDTRVAALCAQAQGEPHRAYPTFALALALFDDPAWEALSPDRPLRYWRLIEINQPAAQPLTTSALRADERIVNYLKGLNTLDDRLAGIVTPIDSHLTAEGLPPSQRAQAEAIVRQWQRAPQHAALPVAQLTGTDAAAKQMVAAHAGAALGLILYRLPIETLPAHPGDLESLARLWQRESVLLPLALYIDAQEADAATLDANVVLQRFVSRTDGVIFLGVREAWPRLPRASFPVDVARPTTAEQQAVWQQTLNGRLNGFAGELAAQFNLNQATIAQVAQAALQAGAADDGQLQRDLWAACCAITRPRLDTLAQRIDPKATWDDLVLPDEQLTLLHQIADQVGQRHTVYEAWGYAAKMNRGLGISALFAGDSGTGKTMAAEVMANDLQLNLYRIDLSAVVSKYIGETEKNLRRIFDAAEAGGAILLFDEADALFGKRSEVRDSHDRYANIEVSYLLQRMEAYRGLAILTTNLKSALDTAFLRRIRFVVQFPFPDAAQRAEIWRRSFPPGAPVENLDFDKLARLNVAGGNIRNIALNAAFLAADAGEPIRMMHLLRAARTEYAKLEKQLTESEVAGWV